jgi:hypothetical protein
VPDSLTAASFEPHVGTAFRLVEVEMPPELLLDQVTRFQVQPGAPRTEPFSLVFTGDPVPVLPQQVYALEHPELGRLEIFLVPIGPASTGAMRYEAVFN